MTTEQPYFVVQVDRCEKCPHLDVLSRCMKTERPSQRRQLVADNFEGIGPTCPMWPQRVEPPKD